MRLGGLEQLILMTLSRRLAVKECSASSKSVTRWLYGLVEESYIWNELMPTGNTALLTG